MYPSSLLYPAIPSHSLPIHIQSLLYLFISSVLISLFVIALNFSFPFILISTHPILSLLLCYSISILQSILSYLSFRTLLFILPHYSTPFSFILSFPFSLPFHLSFIIYPSLFPFIPFHIILSLPFYSHSIFHPIPYQHHSPILLFLSLLQTTL